MVLAKIDCMLPMQCGWFAGYVYSSLCYVSKVVKQQCCSYYTCSAGTEILVLCAARTSDMPVLTSGLLVSINHI